MLRNIVRFLFTVAFALLLLLEADPITTLIRSHPAICLQLIAMGILFGAVIIFAIRTLTRPTAAVPVEVSRLTKLEGLRPSTGTAEGAFTIQRRARHEAAHAVIALALGKENIRADVVQTEHRGGQVRYQNPGMPVADFAYTDMLIGFGGQIVDVQAGHFDHGSRDDMRGVTDATLLILSTGQRPSGYEGPLTADGLVRGARLAAEQLLEQHRISVDRVTAALIKHGRLNDSDLSLLVEILDCTAPARRITDLEES